MNYLICDLLNDDEIKILTKDLNSHNKYWEDGRKTAGRHAALVKHNLQFNKNCDISKEFTNSISKKIITNPLIKSFTLPKKTHGLMFTKSKKGMHYGRHIDNSFMPSGRADLSFTIFLNSKDTYEGGELSIESVNSEENFKLEAGQMIIYPSTYLHSVKEIIKGERLVCVGWIESYVKSIEEREYLFDLDAGARGILSKFGRSDELDLIFKSYANFLRILGD